LPFFGLDVDALKAGQNAVIDASVLGYPLKNLSEIPAGEYSVQAVMNVYTQVHRKDGHTIWVHMDQWEGQQWNRSPGNLLSDVQKVHLDPAAGFDVRLSFARKIPALQAPEDTAWVKRIKIQSKMLSEFWGYPIYIGATVLLPKGFDQIQTRSIRRFTSRDISGLALRLASMSAHNLCRKPKRNARRGWSVTDAKHRLSFIKHGRRTIFLA